jgi:hypothetical protein
MAAWYIKTNEAKPWLINWGQKFLCTWHHDHSNLYTATHTHYRARIFKLPRSPRINSKESIPSAYVAWRASKTTLFQQGSYSTYRSFKNSSTDRTCRNFFRTLAGIRSNLWKSCCLLLTCTTVLHMCSTVQYC